MKNMTIKKLPLLIAACMLSTSMIAWADSDCLLPHSSVAIVANCKDNAILPPGDINCINQSYDDTGGCYTAGSNHCSPVWVGVSVPNMVPNTGYSLCEDGALPCVQQKDPTTGNPVFVEIQRSTAVAPDPCPG